MMTNPTLCTTGSPVAVNDSVHVLAGKPAVFKLYWYSEPTSLLDVKVKVPLGCTPGTGVGETGPVVNVRVVPDDVGVFLRFFGLGFLSSAERS